MLLITPSAVIFCHLFAVCLSYVYPIIFLTRWVHQLQASSAE